MIRVAGTGDEGISKRGLNPKLSPGPPLEKRGLNPHLSSGRHCRPSCMCDDTVGGETVVFNCVKMHWNLQIWTPNWKVYEKCPQTHFCRAIYRPSVILLPNPHPKILPLPLNTRNNIKHQNHSWIKQWGGRVVKEGGR